MPDHSSEAIEALFAEKRTFPPPKDFAAKAYRNDPGYMRASLTRMHSGLKKRDGSSGSRRGRRCCSGMTGRSARWFDGGTINASFNVDRHVRDVRCRSLLLGR